MSRGRGGGRGGRGGAARTFNREQLNAMGISNNDMIPSLVTQPPPLYPIMERRPVPLTTSLEIDYLLILRQDFVDHMQLSTSYLKIPETKTNQVEQKIDKLVAQISNPEEKYDWNLYPAELRPKLLAKRLLKKPGVVVKKEVDVQEKLKALEKLEETKDKVQLKDEPVEAEEAEEVEEEVAQEDDEMDDGTDYASNYFDNGEGYEDEDDNMDEGPIY